MELCLIEYGDSELVLNEFCIINETILSYRMRTLINKQIKKWKSKQAYIYIYIYIKARSSLTCTSWVGDSQPNLITGQVKRLAENVREMFTQSCYKNDVIIIHLNSTKWIILQRKRREEQRLTSLLLETEAKWEWPSLADLMTLLWWMQKPSPLLLLVLVSSSFWTMLRASLEMLCLQCSRWWRLKWSCLINASSSFSRFFLSFSLLFFFLLVSFFAFILFSLSLSFFLVLSVSVYLLCFSPSLCGFSFSSSLPPVLFLLFRSFPPCSPLFFPFRLRSDLCVLCCSWSSCSSFCSFLWYSLLVPVFFPFSVSSDCGLYRGRECPCMWWSWRWARFSRAWYITGLLMAHHGGEILGKDVTMICYSFLAVSLLNRFSPGWKTEMMNSDSKRRRFQQKWRFSIWSLNI